MLKDPDKVPLFIASDIVIGESSMYADYIMPDLTYLERWGTPGSTPDVPTRQSKVRQPAAIPLTEDVTVDGEKMPLCMETFLIAVAKQLHLTGFGKNAFGQGMDFDRPEDWYLKLMANQAYGNDEKDAVPDAEDHEIELFRQAQAASPQIGFRRGTLEERHSDLRRSGERRSMSSTGAAGSTATGRPMVPRPCPITLSEECFIFSLSRWPSRKTVSAAVL